LKKINRGRFCLLALIVIAMFSMAASARAAVSGIRTGQVVKITVAGHPEFTQSVTVGREGAVDYPLLAGIPIDGLTATEVRDLIVSAMMRIDREPEVYVIVTDVQLIVAQIYGAVLNPGKMEVESPLNLQQLISMSGHMTANSDPTRITIIRSSKSGRQELVVDMTRHFHSDSMVITPDIFDGDVVVVPSLTSGTSIRIFGEVQTPGQFYLGDGDNLLELIRRAGGFTPDGDSRRVVLFSSRNGVQTSKTVDLTLYLKTGKSSDLPTISAGDIVVVPKKESWRSYGWWLTTLRDLAYFASTVILIVQVTK